MNFLNNYCYGDDDEESAESLSLFSSDEESDDGFDELFDLIIIHQLIKQEEEVQRTEQRKRKREIEKKKKKKKKREMEEKEMEQGKENWSHNRIDWEKHAEELRRENRFHIQYRMTYSDFMKLVEILRPQIEPNWEQSLRRCDFPITAEICVASGIMFLGGTKYTDVMEIFKISKSGFFIARRKFMNALLESELKIQVPNSKKAWEKIRKGFEAKSTQPALRGCVGAIDGIFQPTSRPSKKECDNFPIAYHSEYYNAYGLNCQGVVDSDLRFWLFHVASPGGTDDASAYTTTGLHSLVESFQRGRYLVGDDAYILTEHVLVPFAETETWDRNKKSFNYHLLKLQSHAEMAFGLLTTKWRVLRNPLANSLENCSKIIMCCAILHNYCINQNLDRGQITTLLSSKGIADSEEGYQRDNEIHAMEKAPYRLGYLPTMENYENEQETSHIRDNILARLTK